MKVLKLSEFCKLMKMSLDEEDPLVFEDTAMYVVNHYGDDYEEEVNTGEYVLVSTNKSKTEALVELETHDKE